MCECLAYDDGSMHLCEVCAQMLRDGIANIRVACGDADVDTRPTPPSIDAAASPRAATGSMTALGQDWPLYRKRPVVIAAVQWDGEWSRMEPFVGANAHLESGILTVHTIEGDLCASIGDYIVRGIKGEFYPCKPDVFVKSNEPVTLSEVLAQGGDEAPAGIDDPPGCEWCACPCHTRNGPLCAGCVPKTNPRPLAAPAPKVCRACPTCGSKMRGVFLTADCVDGFHFGEDAPGRIPGEVAS